MVFVFFSCEDEGNDGDDAAMLRTNEENPPHLVVGASLLEWAWPTLSASNCWMTEGAAELKRVGGGILGASVL